MRRSGMTLTELLVVLTILAVLTTVAVVSLGSGVDQTRYDATRRTLDSIQDAVLGPQNQTDADGSRIASGFVADTGRLPLAVGADPTLQLAELWSNPRGLPAFGPASPVAVTPLVAPPLTVQTGPPTVTDPDVRLLVGWRGPYLRLPAQPGIPRLLDGWGSPFTLLQADTTLAAADLPVVFAQSAGGPAAPYNTPMKMTTPWQLTATTGTVAGAVGDSDPSTPATLSATVRLFCPSVSTPGGILEMAVTTTSTAGYGFLFTGVPIGPKVLRAYHTYTPSGSTTPVTIKSEYYLSPCSAGGLTRNISIDLR